MPGPISEPAPGSDEFVRALIEESADCGEDTCALDPPCDRHSGVSDWDDAAERWDGSDD